MVDCLRLWVQTLNVYFMKSLDASAVKTGQSTSTNSDPIFLAISMAIFAGSLESLI